MFGFAVTASQAQMTSPMILKVLHVLDCLCELSMALQLRSLSAMAITWKLTVDL